LNFFHLDLTRNLKYDRLTRQVMSRVIQSGSNCIDVGCHKGEMLQAILRLSPWGKHYAFEPIPEFFDKLSKRFGQKVTILPYALSDTNGVSDFHLVKNAPAYSGLHQRKYDISNPDIAEIKVEMRVLDELIPDNEKIDFLKVDVEGGEYHVLRGALRILKESKPVVVFEFGLGASDYYGINPSDMFELFHDKAGLKISTLQAFVKGSPPLSCEEFEHCYQTGAEYYFVGHP
jgi:FkbM family methyltransferase